MRKLCGITVVFFVFSLILIGEAFGGEITLLPGHTKTLSSQGDLEIFVRKPNYGPKQVIVRTKGKYPESIKAEVHFMAPVRKEGTLVRISYLDSQKIEISTTFIVVEYGGEKDFSVIRKIEEGVYTRVYPPEHLKDGETYWRTYRDIDLGYYSLELDFVKDLDTPEKGVKIFWGWRTN